MAQLGSKGLGWRLGVPSGLGVHWGSGQLFPQRWNKEMVELPHPPVSTATHNSCRREEGAALAGAADEPGLGWFLLHQPWPTRVLGHGQRVIKTCVINKQLLKL